MTTTTDRQAARRVSKVDRFLTFIRIFLVGLVVVGLTAFIAQQVAPDNPFARWRNPDAMGLTADQFNRLMSNN